MEGNGITVTVTTRGRYYTALPLCMMAIYGQSLPPKRVILVDDNEVKSFQQLDIFKNILFLFKQKGIEFDYYFGESRGQVHAQQIALNAVKTEWVMKLDDDSILEPDALKILAESVNSEQIGAVSGLILTSKDLNRTLDYTATVYNKIEDIYSVFNVQMFRHQSADIKQAEHLNSCYLFRKSATDGYPLEFAPSGHREDTVFTYQIFLKGYKLLVNPRAVIWHLKDETGGNRVHKEDGKNERLFVDKLQEWKIIPDKLTLETNGDTYVVKNGLKYLVSL
jgi:cellulose synthase/poly-beta-1,6-N-acetylglucosamine synthase-like glycosyltransferase